MTPLFWRLYYADDSFQDEPPEQASILLSRPDPMALAACRQDGAGRETVMKVQLKGNGYEYKPIFYRRRSLTMDGSAARQDALVVGIGRINGGDSSSNGYYLLRDIPFEGVLWVTYDGEAFEGCPDSLVDEAAITHLMTS